MIPTLDDLKAKLSGITYFTVLDLKDGFYQVELTEESSNLYSFSTPFGTYKFLRLPFGITVAPEVFQRMNENIFGDIEGVFIYIDDILVTGKTEEEHNRRLEIVMQRAKLNNIIFNSEKLQYKVPEVSFLGHLFNSDGVKSDPNRVKAIVEMKSPNSKKELQRYLGMINYLRSFIPNLASITEPLRHLLKNNVSFLWSKCHQNAVSNLQKLITNTPILQPFDQNKHIVIQTDASKSGLGCVLMQNKNPIAFASRSLTEAEQNYAQVEKEMLAIVYACSKFHYYIYGRTVEIQTDHKPLVSIMKNELAKIHSSRLQRMKMKLLIYKTNVVYVPGKYMHIADHLSRSYLTDEISTDFAEYEDVVHSINISTDKLKEFKYYTKNDYILNELTKVFKVGWPKDKNKIKDEIRPYWKFRNEIYVDDDIVYLDERIIVPKKLQKEMLKKLHESHLGITKTRNRARQILYWPGIDGDIENMILQCRVCEKFQKSNCKEPLISHSVPNYPFEKIGCDIMTYGSKDYLIVIDYLSKWLEIIKLCNKQSGEIINHLKNIFSTHGIPRILIADNMPFSSREMQQFSNEWNFEIKNSSPIYPRANGQAEKAVDISKNLMKKAFESGVDISLTLLEYRNHPVSQLQYSPAQLLMSRHTRTKFPMKESLMQPKIQNVAAKLKEIQCKSKEHYDKTSKIRQALSVGDNVTYQQNKQWYPAKILKIHDNPRSYVIRNAQNNVIRRNKIHLRKSHSKINPTQDVYSGLISNDEIDTDRLENVNKVNDNDVFTNHTQNEGVCSETESETREESGMSHGVTTRSGRLIKIPKKLKDYEMNFD